MDTHKGHHSQHSRSTNKLRTNTMTTSMTLSRITPTSSLPSARSHAMARHSTEAATAAVSSQKALARERGYTEALLP